jgi:ketosteroid isomerase-like protein
MSSQNVEIVRRLFEAVRRRDAETVLSLYHPDVEWDGSRSRWGEVMPETNFRGHDGLRRFAGMYYEIWEDLEDRVDDMIDAGDHVVVVVNSRARGRASGADVELLHNVGVWTLRDGRITRVVWF